MFFSGRENSPYWLPVRNDGTFYREDAEKQMNEGRVCEDISYVIGTNSYEGSLIYLNTVTEHFTPSNISFIFDYMKGKPEILYRWWIKIFLGTNETAFYVGFFYIFWKLPIDSFSGEIGAPISTDCVFPFLSRTNQYVFVSQFCFYFTRGKYFWRISAKNLALN